MTSFKRRYVISVAGRVLAALLQATVVALLARSLGVAGYGTFAIVSSLALFALSIADLGMSTSVLRIGRRPDRGRILTTVLLWRAGLTTMVVLLAIVAAGATSDAELLLWVATAVYVSGESAGDLAVAAYQGRMQSTSAMGLLIARRLSAVAPFAMGVGPDQALAALFVAGTVGAGSILLATLPVLARPVSLLAYLRDNGRIAITTIGRNLTNLDNLVVGATSGITTAGLYGSAARLSNPINIGVMTLVQVSTPELVAAESARKRLRLFRRLQLPIYVLALAIAGSSVASPWLVEVLFGEEFIGATPVMAAVLIAGGISAVTQLHMSWFYADRVPKMVSFSAIPTGIAGLSLLAVLGVYLGIMGLAVALVLWRTITFIIVLSAWHNEIRTLGLREDDRPEENT